MAYHADLLLVLLNLEDRDDTLMPICNMIDELMKKNEKQNVLLKVFFTKADKLIETKIAQMTTNLLLSQEDYNRFINQALREVGSTVKKYSDMIQNCDVNGSLCATATSVSIRYKSPWWKNLIRTPLLFLDLPQPL